MGQSFSGLDALGFRALISCRKGLPQEIGEIAHGLGQAPLRVHEQAHIQIEWWAVKIDQHKVPDQGLDRSIKQGPPLKRKDHIKRNARPKMRARGPC
jgi:hypothetical protein